MEGTVNMSLAQIEAALRERAEELATARSESAAAERDAWLQHIAPPARNTTQLPEPEMAPATPPQYKAPPAGAAEWLSSRELLITGVQDNAPPVNQRPPPEPDTAPATRPQPKAPPPGVSSTWQGGFQCLALTDIEEDAREDLSDTQSAASQPSGAQINAPSLDQQSRQGPDTRDTQPMPQSSSTAQQQAATTQPSNGWADMSDASDGQVPEGDFRGQQVGQLRTRPNTGIFTSRRFHGNITSEQDYLKRWLLTLQDLDFGVQKMLQEYCNAHGAGTFDPIIHTTAFTRRFLFLYGGQPQHFFTQHPRLCLLPAQEELRILQQYAAQYEATHLRNAPPASSWFWPPRPGEPSLQHRLQSASNSTTSHC